MLMVDHTDFDTLLEGEGLRLFSDIRVTKKIKCRSVDVTKESFTFIMNDKNFQVVRPSFFLFNYCLYDPTHQCPSILFLVE